MQTVMNSGRKHTCLAIGLAALLPALACAETVSCGSIEAHNWHFQISQIPPPGRESCTVNKESIYSNAIVWSQDENTGTYFAEVVGSFDADGESWNCNGPAGMINMLRAECSADGEPDNRIVIEGKPVFEE